MKRYVEWRIHARRDDFDVVRRDDSGAHLVGNYSTLERARVAAATDRRTILADPLMVERCPLEIRVKR